MYIEGGEEEEEDEEESSGHEREVCSKRRKRRGAGGVGGGCQSQTVTLACVTALASRASYRRWISSSVSNV